MKNTLKKLLILMLALACVVGLVACAPAPEKDLEDAKDNLEDADYDVAYSDDDDSQAGTVEYLYAENEDGDSITIVRFEKASTAKLYYKARQAERESELSYYKDNLKLYKHMLKNYSDDMDSETEEQLEERIEEYEKYIDEFDDENVLGRSGKVVWFGTKQAIKDSK